MTDREETVGDPEWWDTVSSEISHDAKNPLNVVSGRLELLDIDETNEAAIERSVARVERLMDALSTLGSAMNVAADPEPVSLDRVGREAWERVGSEAPSFVVETDRSIAVDGETLTAILERLFENSVVHGEAETVRLVGTDEGFAVADDGSGIDPDVRDRVFECGFSTDRYAEGYGLFVVDAATRARGWSAAIEESESGGASVRIATDD